MRKVLSHIYMPYKMTWHQQFLDLSLCLQSCETTSHAHVSTGHILLFPPPCCSVPQNIHYCILWWIFLKILQAWLPPHTSYSAWCHGALLMTAVCKYQYDAHNLVTEQQEWVILSLLALLPLCHPWLQTSSLAAPSAVGCYSSGCRAEGTKAGVCYCSGCQIFTSGTVCAYTPFPKYRQIWESNRR